MSELHQRLAKLTEEERRSLAKRLGARKSAPRLRTFVTLRKDARATTGDLRSYLEERLPAHALPASIEIVDTLPRLPNGKIDQASLAALAPSTSSPEEVAPPNSEFEETLLRIWREVLGTTEISIHDDFFEIGGDSILSIQIISRARSAGLQIAPQDFNSNSTVAGLATVASGTPGSAPPADASDDSRPAPPLNLKHVVPIQTTGSQLPLFCMHSGGDALLYRDLSKRLGADFPVYGVQPMGLEGEDCPESIEGIAIPYLREIKEVQPEGPYCLLGNCFGAAVGLEIAHLLKAQQEEVALLVVVDSAAPLLSAPERGPSIWAAVKERNPGRIWRRLKRNLKAAATTSPAAQRMRRIYIDRFGDAAQWAQERFRAAHEAYLRAFYRYEPAEYHGTVVFFQGTDSPNWSHDALGGWKKLAPALTVEDFDCTHREFLDEPHVQAVANSLRERIEQITAEVGYR